MSLLIIVNIATLSVRLLSRSAMLHRSNAWGRTLAASRTGLPSCLMYYASMEESVFRFLVKDVTT